MYDEWVCLRNPSSYPFFFYPSIQPSFYFFPVHPTIHLFFHNCFSIHSTIHLFLIYFLSIHTTIHLFFIHLTIHLFFFYLSIHFLYPSNHPFFCPLNHPSIFNIFFFYAILFLCIIHYGLPKKHQLVVISYSCTFIVKVT